MIDFIVENWQFLSLALAAIVDVIIFVFALCGKKVDPSIEKVIAELPSIITFAEGKFGPKSGYDKKEYVMECACKLYEKMTDVYPQLRSSIRKTFSKAIEAILETPQKKG